MLKIATHDSATGEKGKGLLSWLGTPFARTQSKTLKEQYEAGCRLFDIRVKLYKGEWYCAHGIWISKRTAEDIFKELDSFGDAIITITYEGDADNVIQFQNFLKYIKEKYQMITYGYSAIKYGKNSTGIKVSYDILDWGEYNPPSKQGFLPLDGKTWHILLPIPWLWKKLYNDKPEFNEQTYIYVDFL